MVIIAGNKISIRELRPSQKWKSKIYKSFPTKLEVFNIKIFTVKNR